MESRWDSRIVSSYNVVHGTALGWLPLSQSACYFFVLTQSFHSPPILTKGQMAKPLSRSPFFGGEAKSNLNFNSLCRPPTLCGRDLHAFD